MPTRVTLPAECDRPKPLPICYHTLVDLPMSALPLAVVGLMRLSDGRIGLRRFNI
jgi:hypothetical protein